MSAMLLKNLPERIKRGVKSEAKKNRRSVNQEAMVLLDEALQRRKPKRLPPPFKPRRPIDHEWLLKAMKEGRT
jgi:hypothetical protein